MSAVSHDDFQPPEFDLPEQDDDDRMYGALSDLASIDTHDTNLRDHPKAYEVLDRLMTHAYAEGRKDQSEDAAAVRAQLLEALLRFRSLMSLPGWALNAAGIANAMNGMHAAIAAAEGGAKAAGATSPEAQP